MMRKFKVAECGKYFESDCFANMWSLRCAPNVDCFLQLNALPDGVSKMRVEFAMQCVEKNEDKEAEGLFVHNFNVRTSAAGWNESVKLKKEDIDTLDTLTFA